MVDGARVGRIVPPRRAPLPRYPMMFIEQLKLGVKVCSANNRMYRVALAPHMRLYLDHVTANEGRVIEEHKTFWKDVKAPTAPVPGDGGAEVECEVA